MKMMTALMTLMLLSSQVFADGDLQQVSKLVETSVSSILTTLQDKKLDKKAQKKKVMTVIEPLFDLPLMAKLVLGKKNWPKFDKKQRKEFTDLFIEQIKDSYFEKVDLLTDEKIEFEKPVWKKKKVHAPMVILSKGKRYKMLYKLYRKKKKWRVYDVEIEGISVVKSFSSQYDQFLRGKTPKELLAKLKEKNLGPPDALKSKEEKSKKKPDAG